MNRVSNPTLDERELDRIDVARRFATYSEVARLYQASGGKCAICGKQKGKRNHALDHCHKTKKLRGILCANCNTAIGMFEEDTDRMRAAIAYLEKHRTSE